MGKLDFERTGRSPRGSADRNNLQRLEDRKNVVAPRAGARIETSVVHKRVARYSSLPARERGSKHPPDECIHAFKWSLPARERGSKHQGRRRDDDETWSLPARERGSKLFSGIPMRDSRRRSPRGSADRNTPKEWETIRSCRRSPRGSADRNQKSHLVSRDDGCRSPRGSADRNTWVSLEPTLDAGRSFTEPGSKLLAHNFEPFDKASLPHRGADRNNVRRFAV